MTDFLLELRSEEIPARMQARARDDLARLFAAEIAKAGLAAAAIETHATPRRLALIARGLPETAAPVREETKGPRAAAPPQALDGFLRKTGLPREALVERDGVLFAIVERPGRATAAVLAGAVPAIVRGFPWPKSMRWGAASAEAASLRWVRPLQGIVALFGDDVVPLAIDGIESGAATLGHRFHHPGPITIGNADDYVAKLKACHVIVDPAERAAIIEAGAAQAAAAHGLRVIPDPGLVAENAGLTEWPVPLLGTFDPAFLKVPREVIQLTMRTNQKYFACVDTAGALAPAFVCTANIAAGDGGAAIVAGNRKVLAARLADARFFWEQDLKVPLAEQARKLDRIVFHEKLGTVADKAARVAKLARWLVEEGIVGASPMPVIPAEAGIAQGEAPAQPHEMPASAGMTRKEMADQAEQAASLCKADLVTGMVGEFPELQGVMGGYYARAQGLPDEVADAIRDHYKPVGQGDEVPTAPVTVAVSLADKLDTLSCFFGIDEPPTGSKDPFALRRAMIGLSKATLTCGLRASTTEMFRMAVTLATVLPRVKEDIFTLERAAERFSKIDGDRSSIYNDEKTLLEGISRVVDRMFEFSIERLKVQQREAGVRHDLIDAVFALGGEDDLVRLLARVKALQGFVATADGANLLAGYRRAANILRKEGYGDDAPARHAGLDPGSTAPPSPNPEEGWMPEHVRHDDPARPLQPAEAGLLAALDGAERTAQAAVAGEDFEGAMAALASLRGPIDAFFEQVTVIDSDPAIRARRLGLLGRVRAACHAVADFSKIEG